jgi:hypothetical protein
MWPWKTKIIERRATNWRKYSGFWIVDLKSIGAACDQHPAMFKRDHRFR